MPSRRGIGNATVIVFKRSKNIVRKRSDAHGYLETFFGGKVQGPLVFQTVSGCRDRTYTLIPSGKEDEDGGFTAKLGNGTFGSVYAAKFTGKSRYGRENINYCLLCL